MTREISTLQAGAKGKRGAVGRRVGEFPRRGDEGNLVAVLVLVVVLSMLVAITVAALIPTFGVARKSQTGEQAVAQANAGLSDALFHLDQMGDNLTSFCAGDPPSSLLTSAGLTSCYVTGSAPLASAPDLRYYVASAVPGALPLGVTEEYKVTSYATVSGQSRTVTALIYRLEDSFGLYGVSGIFANGALKQSNVYEVGGFPVSSFQNNGTVDVGVGPYGTGNCNGDSSGSSIVTIGQTGSTDSKCPSWTSTAININPADPTICSSGQVSTAFAPCIDTSSFVTYNGQPYCPLPGSSNLNTISTTTSITPPSNGVYDCATNGAAVTIGMACPKTNNPCANTTSCTEPLPFGLTSIPPGSYYFDSNSTALEDIDQHCVSGPISIFNLPQACDSNQCPLYQPSSSGNTVAPITGSSCSLPPDANTDVSLELAGTYVNASSTADSPFDFTPGNPANFNFYWSGNNQITVDKNLVYDGLLYAPGAIWSISGTKYETFGSITVNCIQVDGIPTLYFVYPEHPKSFLKNWSVSDYSITP